MGIKKQQTHGHFGSMTSKQNGLECLDVLFLYTLRSGYGKLKRSSAMFFPLASSAPWPMGLMLRSLVNKLSFW